MKRKLQNQSGFTLIELLIVVGILAILLAITIVALNPVKHFQDARNSQRQNDVTTILNAIYAYEAANTGHLPTNLSSMTSGTPYAIRTTATAGNKVDLCGANGLTPTYMADVPKDPSTGVVTGGSTPCAVGVTSYDTGYTLTFNSSGNRFTVSATAEPSGTISSTE